MAPKPKQATVGAQRDGPEREKIPLETITITVPRALLDLERFFAQKKGVSLEAQVADALTYSEFEPIDSVGPEEVADWFVPGLYDAVHAWKKREGA